MTDLVVPTLGESVTEAIVAVWLHKPGDRVAVDEPIVELETDKATLEVGAPCAGLLSEILVAEGETVDVGTVLAKLEPGVEGVATAPADTGAQPAPAATPAEAGAQPATAPEPSVGLDPSQVARSGPDGQITADDLRSFLGAGSSAGQEGPAARKLLAEHGIDASSVSATGPGGRVTKGDVLQHVARQSAQPVAAEPTVAKREATEPAGIERMRMPRIRQTIARRLKEAQNTAAILTTFNEADMTAVMELRRRYKERFEEKHGVRLGFMSFFAKAVVAAAQAVPSVNGRIDGDEIVYHHFVNIGMAVGAPKGLVVPVIRDCQRRSFADIERELGRLAGKAREGKLSEDEMVGGTFTISNGGVFGSLLSTPILNSPQSGILGLHKIQERPMAVDGKVEIRPMMYLALSYDHRLVDGKEAVTFLVRVKESIEDPQSLMLDV